ncbi:cation diffusion facilitator family transporter [Dongia sp.]|uniref:cation diffusion facilitator family transporter n=1 Tax=Dongia sp. TaxID=1977262 RepID=UPI0035B2FE66
MTEAGAAIAPSLDRQAAGRLMRRATVAALAAALVMIAIKLFAYLATGSVSLLSTLFDSALDFAASMVNLIAVRQSLMPADAEHRFGHGKAEPLAGLVQMAFILGSSLILLVEVYDRFTEPHVVTRSEIGIGVMLASIVITGALIFYQRRVVRLTGSVAVGADSAHYGSDFLVNFSVILALVLVAQFGFWWADPVFGLAIAIFIGYTAVQIGRQSLDMLMDREMDDATREKIKMIVRGHAEVIDLHDLKTRKAGLDSFIQFHLELADDISLKEAHSIADAVEAQLLAAFPGAAILIHQDPQSVVVKRRYRA